MLSDSQCLKRKLRPPLQPSPLGVSLLFPFGPRITRFRYAGDALSISPPELRAESRGDLPEEKSVGAGDEPNEWRFGRYPQMGAVEPGI